MNLLSKKIYIIVFLLSLIFLQFKAFARDNNILYTRENISNYFLGVISASKDFDKEAFKYL